MLANRNLAWLSSVRLYQQLRQMQILTTKHWTEVGNPNGRVRGRIEGAEGDGNPIGRPTVSTNLDLWELSETEPPTKEHIQARLSPLHICNIFAAQSPLSEEKEKGLHEGGTRKGAAFGM